MSDTKPHIETDGGPAFRGVESLVCLAYAEGFIAGLIATHPHMRSPSDYTPMAFEQLDVMRLMLAARRAKGGGK